MFRTTGFCIALGAMALISTTSAMADASSCGDAPFPPALPSSSDIAHLPPQDAGTAKHQAFEDVVHWQKDLKTYRDCLNVLIDNDNRKITSDQNSGSKDDLDEVPSLRDDVSKINSVYNHTVDTERSVVSNYDSVSKIYCGRNDVDRSSCQQGK